MNAETITAIGEIGAQVVGSVVQMIAGSLNASEEQSAEVLQKLEAALAQLQTVEDQTELAHDQRTLETEEIIQKAEGIDPA